MKYVERWRELYSDVKEEVTIESIHAHALIKAKSKPLPCDTPMPKRVKTLIKETPDWLRQRLRVIDGVLIQEATASREVDRQTTTRPVPPDPRDTYSKDPALCLGNYVLAGWVMDEIEQERVVKCFQDEEARVHGEMRAKEEKELCERMLVEKCPDPKCRNCYSEAWRNMFKKYGLAD
jgi:hypothetical protein